MGTGGTDAPLAVSVLVHLGSLLAILIVFRNDIVRLLKLPESFGHWLLLIIATIPAAVVGIGFKKLASADFESFGASPWVACVGLLVTSVLLFGASRMQRRWDATPQDGELRPQWAKAGGLERRTGLLIGVAQMLAITPGVSRSGATITTALMLGWNREDAVRFSFLIGVIAIAGAGLLEAKDISELEVAPALAAFLSSLAFSMVGLFAVRAVVRRSKLGWFGVYTAAAGIVGLVWLSLR